MKLSHLVAQKVLGINYLLKQLCYQKSLIRACKFLAMHVIILEIIMIFFETNIRYSELSDDTLRCCIATILLGDTTLRRRYSTL